MFTEKGLQKTDSLTTNNLINSKLRSTILTCKTTQQTTQMEFKLKKKILHLPMKKTELANLAHLTNLQTAKKSANSNSPFSDAQAQAPFSLE
jgi:hypothetical protein